jgi:hypothetical protein
MQIAADHQKPIGVLAASGKQFGALPFGEGKQRRMRRTDDEIEIAVAQRFEGFRNGKQQIDRSIKALLLKKTHLHGSDNGEIRIGH